MTRNKTRLLSATLLVLSPMLLGGCLQSAKTATVAVTTPDPVGNTNSAPTISGNPPSAVMMDSNYSFTPTATDPDGDTLTFNVSNLPSWANFDSANGRVSGQPSLADIGIFSQIQISVSDGELSASIPDYSITVSQGGTLSMTLSWSPPTQNTDGSPLTDLAGYRIYFGTAERNYTNQVDIDTAGISIYVVENLLANTYYAVATSVNLAGIESSYSNVTVKVVQ
jgi:hypothetical protein